MSFPFMRLMGMHMCGQKEEGATYVVCSTITPIVGSREETEHPAKDGRKGYNFLPIALPPPPFLPLRRVAIMRGRN